MAKYENGKEVSVPPTPSTRPLHLLRMEPDSELLKGKIEACRLFSSGCPNGERCLSSHLQDDTEESISAEFRRLSPLLSLPASVIPADASQRSALESGRIPDVNAGK